MQVLTTAISTTSPLLVSSDNHPNHSNGRPAITPTNETNGTLRTKTEKMAEMVVEPPKFQSPTIPILRSHSVNNIKKPRSPSSASSSSNSSAAGDQQSKIVHPKPSPFESVVWSLNHDPKWMTEINLNRRVGFYRFRGELGNGNFSQVKVGQHQLTKEKVAIKILDKTRLDQKTQRMLSREISSMENLHHPNLIRLYEVVETLSKIHLVMEYASGGELYAKISSEGKLTEDFARPLYAQVLSAINYMHSESIIHRDIKAENVFFAGPNWVKVGDFGFSTPVESLDQLLTTFCGSPPYAAPELFRDESYVGAAVDMWAIGVLLFFMVTGGMPFRAQTVASLKQQILDGVFQVPSTVSQTCVALIKSLLQPEPCQRPSTADILRAPWLQKQQFPLPTEQFRVGAFVDDTLTDVTEEEQQILQSLNNYGVTPAMLREHLARGSRSAVVGTFRIITHKMRRRRSVEKDFEPNQFESNGHYNNNNYTPVKRSSTKRKNKRSCMSPRANGTRSKTCTIL